jgi:DNA-3-methyladenine glycosylase
MDRLTRDFYARDTLSVARELLGKRLVRIVEGMRLSGIIIETEAYIGEEDLACHASRGRTPRTEVMYGPPGRAYVYFIYGMYHCLNVVTEPEEFPAAVLVRALEAQEGVERMRGHRGGKEPLALGPGRLCQALAIDRSLNGVDLCKSEVLFVEEGLKELPGNVIITPRVGISADEVARTRPWRFALVQKCI